MKKKTEYIFRFLSMATVITIVSLDFFQIYDFGIDRLIYKVNPLFADLITIIPSLEELNLLDISTKDKISSVETMNRPMNYPLIWVYIFDFISTLGEPHNLFGYMQIFIYLSFAVFYLVRVKKNFLLNSLIIFSPPIFLIFDRGNNDLLIFFLIYLSIYSQRGVSGFLIGLAAALKIYPLFLAPFIFFYSKGKFYFLFGFLLTLPLIIFSFSQLNIFIGNTSISFSSSFGILTMALFFKKIFSFITSYQISIYLWVIFSFSLFLLGIKIFNFFFKNEVINLVNVLLENNKNTKIFVLFSLLSIFIFLVFSSWAYRIIFLLPSTCIIINCINFKKNFIKIKNIIMIIFLTFPFISTWILFSNNKILLNHYTWAFYGPIVFISMIFYSLILLNIAKSKFMNTRIKFFD